jgi:hypothetical protein
MKKIWDEVEKPIRVSIQDAREMLMQWREVRAARSENAVVLIPARVARWQPPEDGVVN